MDQETIKFTVQGGTPGADSNNYTLFDSTTCFSGGLRSHDISRIIFGVQNSQAGTLLGQWSANRGTTWNTYSTTAVAIPGAGLSSGPYAFLVDPYDDIKLIWTNGGVAQATWITTGSMIRNDRASGV